MISNYFITAWRNLKKYKAFSFINIFGLAVAMAVCMLVILMLSDQLRFDNFHINKDRIYRLATTSIDQDRLRATIPFPVSAALKNSSGIEETVYLRRGFGGDAVYQMKYAELRGYFSTPSFFKVFSFPLEVGDASRALLNPGSVIISRQAAQNLFGNKDPIGKTITFFDRGLSEWTNEGTSPVNWGLFTVTGVFAEPKYKSHLEFDAIMSASTLNRLYAEHKMDDLSDDWNNDSQTFSYVLMRKSASENDLRHALDRITSQHFKQNDNESLRNSKMTFQPLTKINPGPPINNSPSNQLPLFAYYILGGLVLVILIASCLNYTSLFVARSVTRMGEIGLRKVIGAVRKDLMIQFLCETLLTFFFSLLLANLFILFLKPAFLNLWINQYLKFDLKFNVYVYVAFVVFSLFVSLISGIYPAIKFSRSRPVEMMRKSATPVLGKWALRRVLTVSQFSISLLFIITSIVIYNQFKYYLKFDYGFNPKDVININLQGQNFEKVKVALENIPGIKTVGGCAYLPSTGRNDGLSLKLPHKDSSIHAIDLSIDPAFVTALEIPLLYGKNIPAVQDTLSRSILVNEETAKNFGYARPGDIVGQHFYMNGQDVTVAGVIRNFTFFLLFSSRNTGPIVMHDNPKEIKYATLKLESSNLSSTIKEISAKWKGLDPIHPLQFEFYEETLANTNRGIFDLVTVLGFLAFLAVTIACLGLLGMAIYTTERRMKEIGIRKVLGASIWQINLSLLKEFVAMLMMSVVIAAPAAFLLNNFWLNFMVVRDELKVGTVLIGVFLLIVLGLATIVPQTMKIARSNPVKSLKAE